MTECIDRDKTCADRRLAGQCTSAPAYTREYCKLSCQVDGCGQGDCRICKIIHRSESFWSGPEMVQSHFGARLILAPNVVGAKIER
uniref:ShKT domain-containing protein n=1 Tax=Romanomermis culicivorax TaxID=13658 RepID=A0A915J2L7_ROMCU